jgi:hypothetical protein
VILPFIPSCPRLAGNRSNCNHHDPGLPFLWDLIQMAYRLANVFSEEAQDQTNPAQSSQWFGEIELGSDRSDDAGRVRVCACEYILRSHQRLA